MFYCVLISLVLIITTIIFWFLNYQKLPRQIPLFYSLPWGPNQMIDHPQFLLVPVLMFFVTFINLVIAWHLHVSQLVLRRVLTASSVLFCLLILITLIRIIGIFT